MAKKYDARSFAGNPAPANQASQTNSQSPMERDENMAVKQTYSNSRQTNMTARRLEFGTIIVPPRKAIRRDKSDFLKFSDYTWSDAFVLLLLILA